MDDKKLRSLLGNKAREIREKANLTQDEVAQKIGVLRPRLSDFERRGENLGNKKIDELFEVLGVKVNVDFHITVFEKKNTTRCGLPMRI